MKNLRFLFIMLWVTATLFALGYLMLPFVLAHVLDKPWINWFGLITVPSSVLLFIVITLQKKFFFSKI